MTFHQQEETLLRNDPITGRVIESEFKEPLKTAKIISNKNWTSLKNRVFNMEVKQIRAFKRFNLLKSDTDDFMTRLDLIDSHQELYILNDKFPKLSKDEREKLRLFVV